MPIHSPEPVLNADLLKQLEAIKKSGKARMVGLTFHKNLKGVFENGLKVDLFDAFLPTYSNPTRAELKDLLPEAKKKDIGLITMKSTRGMKKGYDPVPAWRTFLADGIDTVLKTLTTQAELDQALSLALKSEQGGQKQARATNCRGECTLCGACRACPHAIAIQDTLRTYQYYVQHQGWTDVARAQYADIPPAMRATACGDCGRCELVCPQNLSVRQMIRQAHEALA
jgi:predicted aldo/keto reductase-like oxidoreductase